MERKTVEEDETVVSRKKLSAVKATGKKAWVGQRECRIHLKTVSQKSFCRGRELGEGLGLPYASIIIQYIITSRSSHALETSTKVLRNLLLLRSVFGLLVKQDLLRNVHGKLSSLWLSSRNRIKGILPRRSFLQQCS